MTAYVLWDIDGTLLRSGKRASALYDEAIEYVTGFAPTEPGPGEHGKTDGQIIAERLERYGLDPGHHAAVGTRLDELSTIANSGPERRELAPGVRAALEAVAGAGWVNALLTGNSPTRARVKLVGAGLPEDAFDWSHSFFGDRARLRSEITVAARAALGEDPHVIVGDTPSDDAAAQAAGIPFIAVATGIFSAEELRATGAVSVLDDLVSGLPELLERLSAIAEASAR